jgi:phosphoglycerate dehydrogenase-like enzyme
MDGTQIAVLRQQVHGIAHETYAAALEDRLPECEIALASTPDEERELLETAEIATGLSLSESDLDGAENLELFACVFAGTGHLDLDLFRERSIAVTNAAGVHSTNIAEYVTGAMIMQARRFPTAIEQQQRHEWRSFQTRELYDSTAAVVGLGAIGETVVDRLDAFGMETVGVRYSPEKGGPTEEVYGFDEIHEAVADAEYVVLACPLTDTTEQLIDEEVFRTMRTDAVLVNIARGPVVDTDALLETLYVNGIGGAVLDVTDPEPLPQDHSLWDMGNVVITPHNAGHTPEYFERCADILAENVERLAAGEELRNQVV